MEVRGVVRPPDRRQPLLRIPVVEVRVRHRAVAVVHYPKVGAVKSNSRGTVANIERAEVEAISSPKFGDGFAEVVGDPNVIALSGDAERTSSYRVSSQHSARGAEPRD